MAEFVHLHLHSEYSLLDGACRIKEIPKIARQAGHNAVAITDHGVMYGVIDFYNACRDEGVKPIIGCEVYVAPGSRFDKRAERGTGPYHLVLLCKNEIGYKNLIYMVSCGWTEGFYVKPRIDLELLRTHSEGLIALSACMSGYIPRAITAGNFFGASEYAANLKEIFGADNFYLELQNHGIEEETTINSSLIRIAHELGIGLVATNDVHYMKRTDADTQAIMLCIQTNNVITDGRPIGFDTDEFYYKSTAEMERLFGDIDGGAPLYNTVKIADSCNLEFHFDKIYMPKYPFTGGVAPDEFLSDKTERGLTDRVSCGHIIYDEEYPESAYRERIGYELSVISGMGYSEYFLVVADFISYAKSNGIPVGPGRGSGAGSLVAFLIGITDIDPLRFGLLFERFLNPERISLPDFDVDFCYERRDEVIAYVRDKYGPEHVSQIITFGTMAARAAVRDVGRALGMPYAETDSVAKLIPRTLGITLDEAMKLPELREMYESSPKIEKLLDYARALEGMPRHASTHAAGVVITSEPLSELVPLAVNGGTVVTQFDMDTVAKIGLVKFDFLALRYITIISDTVKRIHERKPDFDIATIPQDDAATMELINAGQTDGVFQLESTGMRKVLTQLSLRGLRDIIAALALYRPGPMDSIPLYIKRRHGEGEEKYHAPALRSILSETYDCIIYQEQVIQIFRAVAGYSYARADIVRRAMSKKKAEALEAERGDFIAGALKCGMTEAEANELFDDMASFSSYALNKSHAAAYAVISYRTAYLKCHYTAEYFASLLDSVLGSEGKTSEYINECSRYGIVVLPPDINESRADYTVVRGVIHYGLAALKGLGRQFIDSVTKERESGGNFRSFYDFALRMTDYDMNRRQVEALIKSGAFDGLGAKRSQLLLSYERILDAQAEKKRRGVTGQLDMFASADKKENESAADTVISGAELDYKYPDVPELSRVQLLELEKQVSGMYFSGHILDDYSDILEVVKPVNISDITGGDLYNETADGADGANNVDGNNGESGDLYTAESMSYNEAPGVKFSDHDKVNVAGVIMKRTQKETRAGAKMMFVSLEDKTGAVEVVVFPKMLTRYASLISGQEPLLISGEISLQENKAPKLLLLGCKTLKDAATPANPTESKSADIPADTAINIKKSEKTKLYLRVASIDSDEYKKAAGLIEIFSGELPVYFYDMAAGEYKPFTVCGADASSQRLTDELRKLLGGENVVYK